MAAKKSVKKGVHSRNKAKYMKRTQHPHTSHPHSPPSPPVFSSAFSAKRMGRSKESNSRQQKENNPRQRLILALLLIAVVSTFIEMYVLFGALRPPDQSPFIFHQPIGQAAIVLEVVRPPPDVLERTSGRMDAAQNLTEENVQEDTGTVEQ